MKKLFVLMAVLALALALSGCSKQSAEDESDEDVPALYDEHGCLVDAGYVWCDVKQKCLRLWEEPCYTEESQDPEYNENRAVEVALEHVSYMDNYIGLNFAPVGIKEKNNCTGCWFVELRGPKVRLTVSMNNWAVSSVSQYNIDVSMIGEQDCLSLNSTLVNVSVEQPGCPASYNLTGDIVGGRNFRICCSKG